MADTKTTTAADHRCALSGGVTVEGRLGPTTGRIIYFGTIDALIAARCLTPSMLALRDAFRQGDPRGLNDEHGHRFNLHRLPTKAVPDRVKLSRWGSSEFAIELPGVRELFPDGIPEKENNEREKISPPRSPRADFCTSTLNMIELCVRGDHPSWPEAMPAEAQLLIKRHVDALHEVFRCNNSKRRAPRPSYLRLVVDND